MRDPKNKLVCVSCQVLSAKKAKNETIEVQETPPPVSREAMQIDTNSVDINSQLEGCQRVLMSKLTKSCQVLSDTVQNVEDEQLLRGINLLLDGLVKLRQLRSQ